MKASTKPPVKPATTETYLYEPVAPTVGDPLVIAWCYPASYEVSMAAMGYLLLFAQLDRHPLVEVARFTEKDFVKNSLNGVDLMGFSFAFELDILGMLDAFTKTGLPLLTADRHEDHPLVFSGGPVPMTNPEPYADFFDFFLIGEGEELLDETVSALHRLRHLPKAEKLLALAREVEGVYVPALYHPVFEGATGPQTALVPLHEGLPYPIKKRWLANMDSAVAATSILSEASVFGHTYLVEVMRGCSHRCRFCLASYSMLPARGPSLESIIEKLTFGLQHTRNIGLVGALIADHPEFEALCHWLDNQDDIRVSFGALRVDRLTPAICNTLASKEGKSLTVAIESGSPALRKRINKHLSQDKIIAAMDIVAASGLKGVKFYGMVGLPDETDDDLKATIDLLKTIKKAHPRLILSLGCSTFVPKAWTPFQWMPRLPAKELARRQEFLRKGLIKTADFKPSSAKWDTVQALFSRGDRRLGVWMVAFWQAGANLGAVKRCINDLADAGTLLPSVDWFSNRARPESEFLPWDCLELTVPKATLWKESFTGS
jgi:radical SAM superfamily enzyme YgiQ (UPF0313 family)